MGLILEMEYRNKQKINTITLMHPFTKGIFQVYKANADQKRSGPMKAYMRDQFAFAGIDATTRRQLGSDYLKKAQLPAADQYQTIIKELWALPEREYQYFAIEFAMKYRKHWCADDITFFEYMATTKSWWDTVDTISNKLIGPWLLKNPHRIKTITSRWNRSENIWLQRLSLIFQLTYNERTDTGLMADHIRYLSASDEFFIRKAIGWALRQYSKYDPVWVKKFVRETPLKPLSRKEALKVIEKGS